MSLLNVMVNGRSVGQEKLQTFPSGRATNKKEAC
jgi:hypothetical protein